ncbi:MAG: YitT family protein, partial [Bacteroidales bacterium]|nr:YitT family protein [Bacteroidales bacterium]
MNALNVLKVLKSYGIITFGVFLYCFSWCAFIIPKGISGGGVTGVASLIYYATDFPISYTYFIVNVVLIILGTIILGKGFGAKTIYGILCASVMLKILPEIEWVTTLSDIDDNFLNALIGGTISAFGIAAIFQQGGSTGGTDIIALIVAKYREISPGKVFMYCDLIIIGSIYILPDRTLADVIYGYVQMVSFSYMVDVLLVGEKQSVQILIFTKKYEEMANMISKDLNRGVTALNSIGWYSQKESKVLVVIARKQQLPEISSAIMEL